MTSLAPGVFPTWRTKNSRVALSEALTPRAGMVQRREVSSSCMALPWPGGVMLVMTKSAVTTSWITMLVAPVLEMLAARSANNCSRSAASAVLPEILSGLSPLRSPILGEVEIFRSLL